MSAMNSSRGLAADARVVALLLANRRRGAPFVVVRGEDARGVGQREQARVDAVVERARIAALKVGAADGADEQRIAGEDARAEDEAERLGRVARRLEHLEHDAADGEAIALAEPHGVARHRAVAMHDRLRSGALGERGATGHVIGVHVRLDGVYELQPMRGDARQVALDLLGDGIDQRGDLGLVVADEVRVRRRFGIEELLEHERHAR